MVYSFYLKKDVAEDSTFLMLGSGQEMSSNFMLKEMTLLLN